MGLETFITRYCFLFYDQNYDAVVGDTTILANRSWFVDFTLPYTDSGVSMVVSIKDNKEKHAWAFLTPLTWDLWVTSACFFVFIGFVIWVLEHRINEDFRGPLEHQVGTSFWFSFSTMVFAQSKFFQTFLRKRIKLYYIKYMCFLPLLSNIAKRKRRKCWKNKS